MSAQKIHHGIDGNAALDTEKGTTISSPGIYPVFQVNKYPIYTEKRACRRFEIKKSTRFAKHLHPVFAILKIINAPFLDEIF